VRFEHTYIELRRPYVESNLRLRQVFVGVTARYVVRIRLVTIKALSSVQAAAADWPQCYSRGASSSPACGCSLPTARRLHSHRLSRAFRFGRTRTKSPCSAKFLVSTLSIAPQGVTLTSCKSNRVSRPPHAPRPLGHKTSIKSNFKFI
jgi:hypothetical protein